MLVPAPQQQRSHNMLTPFEGATAGKKACELSFLFVLFLGILFNVFGILFHDVKFENNEKERTVWLSPRGGKEDLFLAGCF